jgi:hypothetical protein
MSGCLFQAALVLFEFESPINPIKYIPPTPFPSGLGLKVLERSAYDRCI